jgi:hypothetical protein
MFELSALMEIKKMSTKTRCWECNNFPGNEEKCKKDTRKRNKIYALDYICEEFE